MLLVYSLLAALLFAYSAGDRSFRVDYDKNVFLKDGQPYRYISGEIHYFRIHPTLWQDRLQRVRHAGLNAVQVYIAWNFHEIIPGIVDFNSPEKKLTRFVQLAQQNGLDVLLRIGPYACAEWENGGLPWWLLRTKDIALRTSDSRYLKQVKRYFDVLLPILKPLLYKNGGPVIMLQIENEYGSVLCDKTYLRWLRDEVHNRLGADTQLYTTDGPSNNMLKCGSVEGVFSTVDFGVSSSEKDVEGHFAVQRNYSKGGPNVNSEFYTVWFSNWGNHNSVCTDESLCSESDTSATTIANTLKTMDWMFHMNASFSFYMIHGGTNFGFWNGAEVSGPVITSYDYSAPISEAGQITPLYLAIREWIGKLPDWPNPPLEVPKNHTPVAIDNVKAVRLGGLSSVVRNTVSELHCLSSGDPLHFEDFSQQFDLVMYSAVLPSSGGEYELSIPDLHDYAYVFVDDVYQGHLAICEQGTMPFCNKLLRMKNGKAGSKLDILVESHGRLTYPTKNDPKGILSEVKVNGKALTHWLQCGVDLNRLYSTSKRMLHLHKKRLEESGRGQEEEEDDGSPAVYVGTFESEVEWRNFHTFFDSSGWGKGSLVVNGVNLGRYWPTLGPQVTLYAPGAVFRKKNTVVLLELVGRVPLGESGALGPATMKFVEEPIYTYYASDPRPHHTHRHNKDV